MAGTAASAGASRGDGAHGLEHAPALRRVPYFILIEKFGDELQSMRHERDEALEEAARNSIDLSSLEEQIATTNEQLQTKTQTIEKLVAEHKALESELSKVQSVTRSQDKRYEVLQVECASLTREYLRRMRELERQVDRLTTENTELRSVQSDTAVI